MKRTLRSGARALAVLAILAIGLGACVDDDEVILVEPEGGELFDRYVSLGNSITAGFQSQGINVNLQEEAYPVLLAARAGAQFGIPALALPGCPPPIIAPFGPRTADIPCQTPPRTLTPPPLVQNLAVPGADVSDVTDPLGTGTPLNAFILGGRTQAGAMVEADPTLVSVWIGNNNVVGASLVGDTLALTPLADFQSEYDELVQRILETNALEVVLIGVVDAGTVVPALQPGAYFWAVAQNPPPQLPVGLQVSDNCSPFGGAGAANSVSFLGLGAQLDAGLDPVTVDCVNGINLPGVNGDFLLEPQERAAIAARIQAFNAYIEQVADENGWIYVDPSSFIMDALANPDRIRKCQALATLDPATTTPTQFVAAVESTCPVDLDPGTEETFYGSFFSFDGVHPSSAAHEVIADTLANRLGLPDS